ncbi:hypothetical protein [Natronorubrum halophilum]|nr:hypothetical protein [Natronorubrum halophilum]
MNELASVVLETGTELPEQTGWVVFGLGLLVTVGWLAYLYR